MANQVLTPQRRGELIELASGRWKKQILPIGSIKYHGRDIKFDRSYLNELVQSFRQSACGPVPFQLADAKNTHTNDPERRRGTLVDLEVASDGLYGIVELDEDGAKLVEEYPDLGVSARIYENYERSDGKFFRAAIQHVLGTLDPHIPGMHPWQAVALGNDFSGPVIDLSDSEFVDDGREEAKPVATKSDLKEILAKLRESGDEADLTDEELDQLLAITDAMAVEDKSGKKEEKPDKKPESELTDEELDALIAAAEALDDETTEGESGSEPDPEDEGGEPVPNDPQLIAATRRHQEQIELANRRLEQQDIQLAAVQAKLDAKEFEAELRTFAEQFGIPPRITELARPLLEGSGHVLQLSNGDEVDPGAVMRKVLTELGSTIKALDLGRLIGNSEDEPNDTEREAAAKQADEIKQWVSDMRKNYSY